MSIIFKNATIVDGSGSRPYRSDVLVSDRRIASIDAAIVSPDSRVIDCSGLTLAPGFIDSHTHSDLQILEERTEKLRQGVTTEVVGNCGFSAYPPAKEPAELRAFANGIFCGDDCWGWPTTEAYLRAIEESRVANVVSLIGHGSLRIAVAGPRQGELSDRELASMESLLREALSAGAAGLSTGLMYAPGSSAPTSELRRLCTIVAEEGKLYTSHIRDYFAGLVDAIDEQVDLARTSGVRLQISHLQAVGAANWHLQSRAIEAMERAREEGIDVEFDCYPYIAGSSMLSQLLPQSALDGGMSGLLHRLTTPALRAALREETARTIPWRWDDVRLSSVASERNLELVGKSLSQIGDERGVEPVDALLDLLLEEKGDANMLSFNQSEENLRTSLTHPLATVISDGFYVKRRPHPRLYGTFPLLLGTISRDRGWMPIEQAVHKITAKPARRYGLKERGLIEKGYLADLVLFDADRIDSPATYENPSAAPVGIHSVYRGGEPIYPDKNSPVAA